MISEKDKSMLEDMTRLTNELVEMKHNIELKYTDNCAELHGLKANVKAPVNITVPEAFEVIRKFINREISEFANKEDYSSLSRCYDAKQYLEKLVKFFDDACDYCL